MDQKQLQEIKCPACNQIFIPQIDNNKCTVCPECKSSYPLYFAINLMEFENKRVKTNG